MVASLKKTRLEEKRGCTPALLTRITTLPAPYILGSARHREKHILELCGVADGI